MIPGLQKSMGAAALNHDKSHLVALKFLLYQRNT